MHKFFLDLLANHAIVRRWEDKGEHSKKSVHEGVQGSAVRVEEVEEGTKDGPVLEVVILQRQGLDEDGEDLVEGDGRGVADNDAGDGASGIVLSVQTRCRCVSGHIEQGAESTKDLEVLSSQVDLRALNKETSGKCGIAEDLVLVVTESAEEELHQLLGIGSNGTLHSGDNFGEAANGCGTVAQ